MSTFLPEPREVPIPALPPVEALEGLPVVPELEALRSAALAARQSVSDLFDHRPGGARWKAALADDAADGAAGKRPKRWRTAAMLDDDAQRWAEASVRARAAAAARRDFRAADLSALLAAVEERRTVLAGRIEGLLVEAWESLGPEPGLAVERLRAAEALALDYAAAVRVSSWLREGGDYSFPQGGALFPAGRAAGYREALRRRLGLEQGIRVGIGGDEGRVYPPDYSPLAASQRMAPEALAAAMAGSHYSATR